MIIIIIIINMKISTTQEWRSFLLLELRVCLGREEDGAGSFRSINVTGRRASWQTGGRVLVFLFQAEEVEVLGVGRLQLDVAVACSLLARCWF